MNEAGARERREVSVGIDMGTQSVRVVVVDDHGSVCALAAEPLTSSRAGDRHEQSPRSWWDAVGSAARRAIGELDRPVVRAVAVCGTSGTFTLARGTQPVTTGVMYDDGRGRGCAAAVHEAGGAVWARLGYPMQGTWALPRLCAVLEGLEPELRRDWDRGALTLLHQGDLVNASLTGHRVVTDWAQALKSGYDVERLTWPHAVLDDLGVSHLGLPEVVAPGTIIGTVGAHAAEHTGIPAGALVVSGTTDSCAAQIAAGALDPGSWNSVLGTTLAIKGAATEPLSVPGSGVYSHRAPDGGWLPGGASSAGAAYLRQEFPGAVGDDSDAAAAGVEPAPGVTYPLVGSGERFPFDAPTLTAFTTVHEGGHAERYAAALQGLALVERMAYDVLERHGADVRGPVSATGGATGSRYLLQLRADVLGRSLRVPGVSEPAFGMAILATAAGRESLREAARRMVRTRAIVDPDLTRAAIWDEQLALLTDELARRGVTREPAHVERASA
ncbi:FGGY-family carbohydrate kinase [Pseudactinotalea sp.]|uniref:FGGY-family carbohydrate kinase n=1 Tax=Pseudactinotalea sp. TaxID=1926260 RepID=UPI003B3BCFE4